MNRKIKDQIEDVSPAQQKRQELLFSGYKKLTGKNLRNLTLPEAKEVIKDLMKTQSQIDKIVSRAYKILEDALP